MKQLTDEHIAFIIKDLDYRGLVLDGLREEMTDHICSAVEEEMEKGKRFAEAYRDVLKAFGETEGLHETQKQISITSSKISPMILKNNLVVAWRSLRKNSFYSIVNITGLAIGIAACLIIVLYVKNELSYDRFNANADRVFRLDNTMRFGDNFFNMSSSAAPVAHTLIQEYPEIESAVRLVSYGTYLVNAGKGDESIKEQSVLWADSSVFKVFDLKMIHGDARTALVEPYSIAISERIAEKYFPTGNAIGRSLNFDNMYNGRVTAVYKNIPEQSHLHADILISMYGDWPVAREARQMTFSNKNFYTYLLLKKNTDPKGLEAKFPDYVKKYINTNVTDENYTRLSLLPLADIHLYGHTDNELENNGSIVYVYLFETIALFILIIACINFMNMSTARSGNRAKEVGIRKVMGSLRKHLMRQFLIESVVVTAFAFVVAVLLAYLFLPVFNTLAAKELALPFKSPVFYVMLLVMTVVIGVLAGIYPSFFLSAFKPVNVLKGQGSGKNGLTMSMLVVFQFMISILLIVGAIAVNRQLAYIQNKKLGFQKDQVLLIKDAYILRPNVASFKNQIASISSIERSSVSGFIPVENLESSRSDRTFWAFGKDPVAENFISLQDWHVDYDYIPTLGMEVIKGRAPSTDFPSDESAIVLNEAAVTRFGLGDDPIGKQINTFSMRDKEPDFEHPITYTVIGVVKDFHYASLKENIAPLGLRIARSDGFIMVKLRATDAQATIASLKNIWKAMVPGQPFQYTFLEEDFDNMYASEIKLGSIFNIFGGLAIFIACLGLFALTAFTIEQRTKEIGIRKVLGASIGNIIGLLSKDLGKLVLIAFILSIPLAWYAVNSWLESYSYRTDIGVFVYAVSGLLVFAVAFITMGSQSIKAAKANPVDSIRGTK